LRTIALKLLSLQVLGIAFYNLVFDFLHHVDELVEGDRRILREIYTFLTLELLNHLLDFTLVLLQGTHDCLQVLQLDFACLLLVKEVEDLSQVLNFLVSQEPWVLLPILLLENVVVGVVVLLLLLLEIILLVLLLRVINHGFL